MQHHLIWIIQSPTNVDIPKISTGEWRHKMKIFQSFHNQYLSFQHTSDEQPDAKSFHQQYLMHAHDTHEVYYLISGDGQYVVEGNEYPLEPGIVMVMRSNEVHRPQIKGNVPYERMAIHFHPEFVDQLDPGRMLLQPFENRPLGRGNYYRKDAFNAGFIHECFSNMSQSHGTQEEKALVITVNFYAILAELRRGFLQKDPTRDAVQEPKYIVQIINYINHNLTGDLSLDLLCRRFFISKSHLNHIFREATGSTVWEYVQVKRLFYARQMIRNGETAQSAAGVVGFNDYSAFYKAYKRKYGLSPQEDKHRQTD